MEQPEWASSPSVAYFPDSWPQVGSLAAIGPFGGRGAASIAHVPDFLQALVERFDKNGRARLRVLPETRHAEDDVVRLRVVTGAVAVGHHGAVAAEHFHRGWDLMQEHTGRVGPVKGMGGKWMCYCFIG